MNENKDISIRLDEELFSSLILNFLGNKESIRYSDRISFRIDLNDIEQFYYLLESKIKKEQFTHINNFTLSIVYNDNTKRRISGINQLNKFNEIRTVHPISITLTWNIILNFPTSKNIENQKIDISFYIQEEKEKGKKKLYQEHENDDFYFFENDNKGNVLINIEHTNQAWAIEVLNLLKTQTESLAIDESKGEKIYNKTHEFINKDSFFSMFFLVVAVALYIIIFDNNMKYNSNGSEIRYSILKEKIEMENINDSNIALYALEYLSYNEIKKVSENNIKSKKYINILEKHIILITEERKNTLLKIYLLLGSILISFVIINFHIKEGVEFYEEKSFILITRKSYKMQKIFIESKKNNNFYSIGFVIFSITIGLIVNFMYQYITH